MGLIINLLALFLSLLLIPQPSKAFSSNSKSCPFLYSSLHIGSLITDLDSTITADFLNEASSWTVSGPVCSSCSQTFTIPETPCTDFPQDLIYGGPNIIAGTSTLNKYYQRTYPGITVGGSVVALGFDLWVFSSTDLSSTTTSSMFDIKVNGIGFAVSTCPLSSTCMLTYTDSQGIIINYIYKYQYKGFYDALAGTTSLTLKITNKFQTSSKVRSFGFKNIKIYTGSSIVSNSGLASTNFPCPYNSYWAGTQCSICYSTCKTCSGPSNSECSACQFSYYNYYNGSCLSTCNPPFIQQTVLSSKYCQVKCSSGFYWAHNQSCTTTCHPPLITTYDAYNFASCSNPCNTTSQFLYPDGSCQENCPSPLLPNIFSSSFKLCGSPCSDPEDYVYPNASCYRTCPAPLYTKSEASIKYCENPCKENGTFLIENTRECSATCPLPSTSRSEPIGKFCKYPCKNLAQYYFEPTGACQASCDFPYTAVDFPLPKLCKSSLSQEEIEEANKLGETADTTNSVSSNGLVAWSLISSSDSTAACIGPVAKMLQYIKFMNINFPEKVAHMLLQQSSNSEGFTSKMARNLLDEFPAHELPGRFETYKVPASFFVNFWPTLFNVCVILFGILILILAKYSTKKSIKFQEILKSLIGVLKWNVPLITFCGSLGDVVLFTSLEFQTMQFDNFAAIFSFLLCLTINTLAVYVVVKILDVNSLIRNSMKTASDPELQKKQIEQEWSSYRALFECYRDYSYYQQIFLFVFIIRVAFFNALIGYLYIYPLFQATVITLLNLMMLIYLFVKRPMKKIVSLVQQIVLEVILLPFNCCVLALAIMDQQEIDGSDHRKRIGDVMVYINVIVPFVTVALMTAKFIAIAVEFYKQRKTNQGNKLKEIKIESCEKSAILDPTEERFNPEALGLCAEKTNIEVSQVLNPTNIVNKSLLQECSGSDSSLVPPNMRPRTIKRPKISKILFL